MILPTSLILKAYPTLIGGRSTRDTCQLLNLSDHHTCMECPAFSGDSVPGFMCSFMKTTNPDYDQMFKLFYDEYPEYFI